MKLNYIIMSMLLVSCGMKTNKEEDDAKKSMPIQGTWQLISGTIVEGKDTTITDYTTNLSFIKIINNTHFAFLNHDLKTDKDTAKVFVAGGGVYTLQDSLYTEHLDYCNDRQWEGNTFAFVVTVRNDTLIQQGVEKVESAGVNRLNIEKYKRISN